VVALLYSCSLSRVPSVRVGSTGVAELSEKLRVQQVSVKWRKAQKIGLELRGVCVSPWVSCMKPHDTHTRPTLHSHPVNMTPMCAWRVQTQLLADAFSHALCRVVSHPSSTRVNIAHFPSFSECCV